VVIDEHREDRGVRPRARVVEYEVALILRPAEICAARIGNRQKVNFFPLRLSDVGNRYPVAVEGKTPRVA